jgi:hypothetical protein
VGLFDLLKRRIWKGAVVNAINRKYEINIRAETSSMAEPTLENILDRLYDPTPYSDIAGVAAIEKILAERGYNLSGMAAVARMDRNFRDR